MKIETLKFWCQKVLPLVYDDSLSYYELLNKVVDRINEIQNIVNDCINEVENLDTKVDNLDIKIDNVKNYVDDYFDNLDITQEVSNIILQMFENGELTAIIASSVGSYSTPIFVATMNDMTDTNRIYVLESNRHIYQAIDGLFFDTGVEYGSGDTFSQEAFASQNGAEITMYTEAI